MKTILLFLFATVILNAQSGTYQRLFPDYLSQPISVVVEEDNSVAFLTSNGYIVKLDAEGFIIWTNYLGCSFNANTSLHKDNQNGYFVAGTENSNAIVKKVDFAGSIIWEKIVSNAEDGISAISMTNGILFMSKAGINIRLSVLDNEGNILNQKVYSAGIGFSSITELYKINSSLYVALACKKIFYLDQNADTILTINKNAYLTTGSIVDDKILVGTSNSVSCYSSAGVIRWDLLTNKKCISIDKKHDGNYYTLCSGGIICSINQNGQLLTQLTVDANFFMSMMSSGFGYLFFSGNPNSIIKTDDNFLNEHFVALYKNHSTSSGGIDVNWIQKNVLNIDILLSLDGGNSWDKEIESLPANSLTAQVYLPYVTTDNAVLRIQDSEDTTIYDISKFQLLIDDSYSYIAANNIRMWVGNDGSGSHDPNTDASGLYWPGGENATKTAVFQDGLIWGGKIGSEIRVNGNTHRAGLQPGCVYPGGIPGYPYDPHYKIFKLKKGWQQLNPYLQERYQYDIENWPTDLGAEWEDVNNNGIYEPTIDKPYYIGDEVLFYVANDLDTNRSLFTYGTLPMGLQFTTTTFAYYAQIAQDIVFKKYLIINKGNNFINDMILGYWSDPDLGDANDDFSGCDTTLNISYTYNSSNSDGTYGVAPPAVGFKLLQGPIVPAAVSDSGMFIGQWKKGYKNLPMTAFTFYVNGFDPRYRDPQQGVPSGSIEFYNYLTGRIWDGAPFIDPNTGQEVKYSLAGDPVSQTGWYEGGWPGGPPPGDRRELMASGPFNFAPGDTQEVIIAIIVAKGDNNINSITALRNTALTAQNIYETGFSLTPVEESIRNAPLEYSLSQNYPNPFNPRTIIQYNTGKDGIIKIKVYDLLGREVRTLVDEFKPAGNYRLEFNAEGLASGVYFYRMQADNIFKTKKLLLLR